MPINMPLKANQLQHQTILLLWLNSNGTTIVLCVIVVNVYLLWTALSYTILWTALV